MVLEFDFCLQFIAGCGKFFEGTAEQMYQSLCVTLSSLPKPTRVYCGHEVIFSPLIFSVEFEASVTDLLLSSKCAGNKGAS